MTTARRLMQISYSGGWEEGDRPSPAPFYMSSAGYGVLRNTWSEGEYDFRSDTYLSARHAENRFDAYVMVGESVHEVLDLYTLLTGRAGLLPRWAMGYGDADCYNLARLTETTGAPMVRGLMWDHPEDPHAFGEDFPYQFLLGPELLIAPVYQSQRASGGWRSGVHLPAGCWFDYWDGRLVEAGPEGLLIDIPVDLATLPVLVRAGAIIPMYPEALYDGQVPADPLTLDLYPYGHSEATLYEDDGSTRAYQRGEFSEQRFEVRAPTDAAGLTEVVLHPAQGHFNGMLEERSFELAVHGRAPPREVRLDGRALPALADREALEAALNGWIHDPHHRGGTTFVHSGVLSTRESHRFEQLEEAQEVRFAARAGRLLRLRILSAHDDGVDPMVLGATSSAEQAYDALAPVKVSPVTISELRLIEHRPPALPPLTIDLMAEPLSGAAPVMVDGLSFPPGLEAADGSRYDFSLRGDLTELRADAGLLDSSEGALRFQVWGDQRLLWDSESRGSRLFLREVKPFYDFNVIS